MASRALATGNGTASFGNVARSSSMSLEGVAAERRARRGALEGRVFREELLKDAVLKAVDGPFAAKTLGEQFNL